MSKEIIDPSPEGPQNYLSKEDLALGLLYSTLILTTATGILYLTPANKVQAEEPNQINQATSCEANIVLLVDGSGSMANPIWPGTLTRIEAAQEDVSLPSLTDRFVNDQYPNNKMAVVQYDDVVQILQPMTNNANLVKQGIASADAAWGRDGKIEDSIAYCGQQIDDGDANPWCVIVTDSSDWLEFSWRRNETLQAVEEMVAENPNIGVSFLLMDSASDWERSLLEPITNANPYKPGGIFNSTDFHFHDLREQAIDNLSAKICAEPVPPQCTSFKATKGLTVNLEVQGQPPEASVVITSTSGFAWNGNLNEGVAVVENKPPIGETTYFATVVNDRCTTHPEVKIFGIYFPTILKSYSQPRLH